MSSVFLCFFFRFFVGVVFLGCCEMVLLLEMVADLLKWEQGRNQEGRIWRSEGRDYRSWE